jgi:predicted ferric reductase
MRKILRVINYIIFVIIVVVLFNIKIDYSLWDLFFNAAITLIIVMFGYGFAHQSKNDMAVFFSIISWILLIFYLTNLGYYYPDINLITKGDFDKTFIIRESISGWFLITSTIILAANVLFAFILHYKKQKDEIWYDNSYT